MGLVFSLKIDVIFATQITEIVAQLVRASDCGSEGRGFESRQPPFERRMKAEGWRMKIRMLRLS